MTFENPMTFVRAMKGAPASVLWAFLFSRKPMTITELQTWTAYRRETIAEALRMLTDLGWLSTRSSRGPWALTSGRQLPLMDDVDFFDIGDSSSCSSSNRKDARLEQEQEEPMSIFSTSRELTDLSGPNSEARRALVEAGVREPKLSRLARLPHVTPELVRGHVRLASEQRRGLGTAIYRIENDWPVQGVTAIAHPAGCTCDDCFLESRRAESLRDRDVVEDDE